MSIYLIRHAQTDLNAARVIQHPHTPLSERGLEQARRVGRRLAQAPIDLVLSSDSERARRTAQEVAAGTGAPLELSVRLRERNFGDLRGSAYDSHTIDVFDEGFEPANGETWPEFHRRVDAAWEEVLARAATLERDLAVVTHGLVLNSLIDRVLVVPQEAALGGWVVENTSVTVVDPAPPYAIRLMGCTTHLEGLTAVSDPGVA